MNYNPCFLIPNYNHSDKLAKVLGQLQPMGLPCLIVDDGSEPFHKDLAKQISTQISNCEFIERPTNMGKGAAVQAGLKEAFARGFTHAVQVDADGQHNLARLPQLLKLSKANPEDFVTGIPIFSSDIPKARLWGRYITHFWVWVETLSFKIKDSMCGFRSYPLKACMRLLSSAQLGDRMEFDTEVVVKLFWQGVRIQQLPVEVAYPEDGKSHFRPIHDNVRITWSHTKLFFGMLFRSPKLFSRSLRRMTETHWSKKKELGSVLGMRILLSVYALFGRRILNLILAVVVGYYYLFNRSLHKVSSDFLKAYREYALQQGEAVLPVSTYRHIFQFAQSMLDKLAVWRGDIQLKDVNFPQHIKFEKLAQRQQGALFFTSHFGNIEVCRCLVRQYPGMKVNVLMYTHHAKKFQSLLSAMSGEVSANVIPVDEISLARAIELKDRVDRGEWIFIMADRTSITSPGKTLDSKFLGKTFPISLGPLVLAQALEVPVYSIHSYKKERQFHVQVTELPVSNDPSVSREQRWGRLADSYLKDLEGLVLKAPLQWFNFYNVWKADE